MFGRSFHSFRHIVKGNSYVSRAISTYFFRNSQWNSSSSSSSSSHRFAAAIAMSVLTLMGVSPLSSSPTLLQESNTNVSKKRELYPPIKPFQTGDIRVSDIHTVHYEVYGNPRGKPVLFVHGGPGGGTSPKVIDDFIFSPHEDT